MPIEFLDAEAQGNGNQWTKVGAAATKWESVLKGSGDATYVTEVTAGQYDTYITEQPSNEFQDYTYLYTQTRAWHGGTACTIISRMSDDNFVTHDYSENIGSLSATHTWYEKVFTTKTTWTFAMFTANDVEHGMNHSGGAGTAGVGEVYVEFNYSVGGGAGAWLSWLPPVLAAGAHLFGSSLLVDDEALWLWMRKLFREQRHQMDLPRHPNTGAPHVIFPSKDYKDEREFFWQQVCRRPAFVFLGG